MKYRCNHCDITFNSEKKDKVRCPECMGIHDVEPEGAKADDKPKARSRAVIPAILILVAVAGAVVYFATQKKVDAGDEKSTVNLGSAKDKLKELGIDVSDAIVPFESSDELKQFAKNAVDGKDGADAVAAIYSKLQELRKAGKWHAFSQGEPRVEGPRTADELLTAITGEQKKDTRVDATSYEIACLMLAAGQSVGIEGLQMVEILNFKKEKAPADPSAIYSRYAVILGDQLFDPWAGRTEKTADANIVTLDASGATAPFYAHRSLSKFARLDLSESLKDNQTAVALAPDNAIFKIHRGKIFLGSSAIQEAMAEFEKAKKARDWAITKVSLAQIQLMTQSSLTDAESAIREALTEFPEYHQAHTLLAALFMMRGDSDSARQELDLAEKIAPSSPEVAATRSQLAAMTGNTDEAIQYAQKAVRLSKENFQSLMILAQVYRATARFDEMREVAQKAMEKAPSEAVREELRQVFQLDESVTKDISDDADDTDEDSEEESEDLTLDFPKPAVPGDLKLNLQNEAGSSPLGGSKLKLGGSKRPGLGGDLQLEMNQ